MEGLAFLDPPATISAGSISPPRPFVRGPRSSVLLTGLRDRSPKVDSPPSKCQKPPIHRRSEFGTRFLQATADSRQSGQRPEKTHFRPWLPGPSWHGRRPAVPPGALVQFQPNSAPSSEFLARRFPEESAQWRCDRETRRV